MTNPAMDDDSNMIKDEPADEVVTVFVTRWALTRGIVEAKASLSKGGKVAKNYFPRAPFFYVHRGDYALTIEEAHKQVASMIAKKRKSHEKSIANLDKLADRLKKGSFRVSTK
jgi:hypothetical protein